MNVMFLMDCNFQICFNDGVNELLIYGSGSADIDSKSDQTINANNNCDST